MKRPNNNFDDQVTRAKVEYRLYIIHNNKGVNAGFPRKFGYNGYITHADKGYTQLMNIIKYRRGLIEIAKLYNFKISRIKPIAEWDFRAKKINNKNFKKK